MAEGRFLSRSVSASEQLAAVSFEAAFLFTWCIPHLDVEGRLPGDPMFLKSNVIPLRNEITLKKIPRLVNELAQSVGKDGASLVVLYEAGRRMVLFFPGFEGQQKGLRKEREAASKLPPLRDALRIVAGLYPDQLRSNAGNESRVTPAQVEVKEKVKVKVKSKNLSLTLPLEFAAARSRYPRRSGGDSQTDAQKAWNARLRSGVAADVIIAGVERYRTYCDRTGKTGTEYVKLMATFLGPARHFEEPWDAPADPADDRARSIIEHDEAEESWMATRRNGA